MMNYYCEVLYRPVYATLKQARIRPLQPEVVLYHSTEYREMDMDVEAAVAVHPKHTAQNTLHEAASFREVAGHELMAGLIYVGPLREAHFSGPVHAADAVDEETVTELQVPIAPIRES